MQNIIGPEVDIDQFPWVCYMTRCDEWVANYTVYSIIAIYVVIDSHTKFIFCQQLSCCVLIKVFWWWLYIFLLSDMPDILLLVSFGWYYTRIFNESFDIIFIYACFDEYTFQMIRVDPLYIIILFILFLNNYLLYQKLAKKRQPINEPMQLQGWSEFSLHTEV